MVEDEDGSGSPIGDFWYRLRSLHCLTGQGGWKMRIDAQLKDGTNFFLQYKDFTIAFARFYGNTNDGIVISQWNVLALLTTKDRDNDPHLKHYCALFYGNSYVGRMLPMTTRDG